MYQACCITQLALKFIELAYPRVGIGEDPLALMIENLVWSLFHVSCTAIFTMVIDADCRREPYPSNALGCSGVTELSKGRILRRVQTDG